MTSIFNSSGSGLSHKVSLNTKSVSERLLMKDSKTQKAVFTDSDLSCIVTTYSIAAGDTVQFASTLGKNLYAYVLGNQPYTLAVQGLLFNTAADGSDKPVAKAMKQFNDYKASTHNTISVSIGDLVFTALLENLSVAASAEQGTDIFTFKVVLRGVLKQ